VRFAYAAAVLAAGFLVFVVQPLAGRQILPAFGGAPSVWATSLVFFQASLLAGYCYAHMSVRYLGPRAQAATHVALLLAAAAFPIGVDADWAPSPDAAPAAQILWLLARTVGLPFVVLAATAPLLQSWHARSWPARSPYRLYAVSNAAAFAALIAYPFAIEPHLRVPAQVVAWRASFVLAGAVSAACALHAARSRAASRGAAIGANEADAPPAVTVGARVLWFALPFAATVVLLAVTNALSLDLAPVPFLWIAPLGIYLLTYVLAFSSDREYARGFYVSVLFVALGALIATRASGPEASVVLSVSAHLFALFAADRVCHGELAALRPPPRQLTRFYLAIGVGGALGGAFVGLVAPVVFNDYTELPAGFLLCAALAFAACFVTSGRAGGEVRSGRGTSLGLGWVAVLGLGALGLVAAGFAATARDDADVLHQERGFFGVLRVVERGEPGAAGHLVSLVSGTTPHGAQLLAPGRQNEATTYYGTRSGVGRVLRAASASPAPLRVGAVGLGAGTLATYGRAGDTYRFYELDPRVVSIAGAHFGFLRDSAASAGVVLGDARRSLSREAPNAFDVLVLDAFSSDAIPVHLLTLEAFESYLAHLAPRGVIAAHISNRHLDLRPVIAGAAVRLGLHAVVVRDEGDGVATAPSTWALLSREREPLAAPEITSAPGYSALDTSRVREWTDDYSPLLPIVRFGLPGFE
jgi:hypothetical protein